VFGADNMERQTVCYYCARDVTESDSVPGVNDYESWEELSRYHAEDCEWIRTRAHRLPIHRFENAFESLGDPSPKQAESAREYARGFLPMFVEDSPGQYRIDALIGHTRIGSATELKWWDDLYDATENKQPYDWAPADWSGTISEDKLLDFLEKAVQQV